jgi:hypothetical protein
MPGMCECVGEWCARLDGWMDDAWMDAPRMDVSAHLTTTPKDHSSSRVCTHHAYSMAIEHAVCGHT